MTTCACPPGIHERTCDYCGYVWDDSQCPHEEFQHPCPECDVLPVVQAV